MKICKILVVCFLAFFAAAGCNAFGGEKAATAAGPEAGGSSGLSRPVINVNENASKQKESEEVPESKSRVSVKYYDAETDAAAYKMNGNVYMNLNDISRLFRTKITYEKTDNTVHIGDVARANAGYYMPDLSAYPNLDDVIGLPPYEIWTDGGVVDFTFVTKGVAFSDMMPQIDKALKADGFAAATKEEYTELTKTRKEFRKGEIKNTYIKYKKEEQGFSQNAIQILDGGLNKNKIPVMIVQMGDV